MKVLIGSGFYAARHEWERYNFLIDVWIPNTVKSGDVVIVDNSELPCYPQELRVIRCIRNLGHACTKTAVPIGRLCGWSLSWILPALIAYADGCDFVYKEQDCLAFGDWLPRIRMGRMAFGRNQVMPCEQSLFYIRNDAILDIVRAYIAIEESDVNMVTEAKFARLMELEPEVVFFDLPGGRDRPFPQEDDFYAQRITPSEMAELSRRGLV